MPQAEDQTPTLVTLINFAKTGGWGPDGYLLADANGDLLGSTNYGGTNNTGTIYELANTGGTYAGTLSTPSDLSAVPYGILGLLSPAGDLFGAAQMGGTAGSGAVFEIAETGGTYAGTPALLVSFNGADGLYPNPNLIADAAGNLFGITGAGGAGNGGTVFEIVRSGSSFASTPTDIVSFQSTGAAVPYGGLYMDDNGNLIGTTQNGGAYGEGEVFEIANTAGTYAGTASVLASFDAATGPGFGGGLVADAHGDLFGTSESGGAYGDGAVYELAKTANGYAGTLTLLASFNATDGDMPSGPLLIDANGDLFGTTPAGGAEGDGTMFEIAKTAGTYAAAPITVMNFNGTDGSVIGPNLVADANGDLFGTAQTGGSAGAGTIFEITGSGFVAAPLCLVQGTRLATPAGDVAVEDLRPGDQVTTPAGAARVRWVGRRAYHGAFINGNHLALPVTIGAGALAEGVPQQALHVSPGHGIWLAGVLVPAWRLINNVSITQAASVETVSYYHVELEGHGLLLAHGAAVESFLDDGAFRHQFQNVAEYDALYPDAPPHRAVTPLPRAEHGFRLAALQAQVNRRAGVIADAAIPGPLRGYAEWSCTENMVHGWAQDLSRPEAAVLLRISAHGRYLAHVIANAYQPALREAGFGSGCHAFSCPVPPGSAGAIEVRREADGAVLPCADRAGEEAPQVRPKVA